MGGWGRASGLRCEPSSEGGADGGGGTAGDGGEPDRAYAAEGAGRVRLGLAPVNWNNDDVPEWGVQFPYAELVATAARLGYAGMEDGTGAPLEPGALAALLADSGLRLPGAYRWARLSDPARAAAELEGALGVARRLAAAGGDVLLVAEHWTEARRAVAGRAAEASGLVLGAEGWRSLCGSLDALGRQVAALGLRLGFHPHVGSPVETPAEVARVMEDTDPAVVGLCLDTGHTVWGGGDAVETARRYARRIIYVHAKDVDAEALRDARARRLGLLDGLRRGVFSPLESTPRARSSVDIVGVGAALRAVGFGGWVIMECDRDPRAGNPADEAEMARPRLREAFAAE